MDSRPEPDRKPVVPREENTRSAQGRAGSMLAADAWLASPPAGSAVERWRTLAGACEEGGVQFHPDVLLDAGTGGEQPDLVFDLPGQDGEPGCVVLFSVRTFRAEPPLGVLLRKTLRGHALIGTRPLGGGSEDARSLVRAATEHLAARRSGFLWFESIDMESPLWRAILDPPPPARVLVASQDEPHWRIRFPENPATYLEQRLSSNMRRNLRVKQRDAQRKWGSELRLERFTEPEQVPSFLETAARVAAKTWQFRRLGRGVQDNDATRALLRRLAELRALRSYVLFCGDSPIAYAVGYQWNGFFDYNETGYDPEYSSSSPGELITWKMVDELATVDPVRVVDFGPGHHEFKARFGNENRPVACAYLVTGAMPGALIRLDRRAREVQASVRSRVKEAANRLGIWKRLRQKYRGSSGPPVKPPVSR